MDTNDTKKLSRVVGSGMGVITVLVFVMGIFENVLPASFATIFGIIVIIDIVITLVIANTGCKK